jgi:hypothetical protein
MLADGRRMHCGNDDDESEIATIFGSTAVEYPYKRAQNAPVEGSSLRKTTSVRDNLAHRLKNRKKYYNFASCIDL